MGLPGKPSNILTSVCCLKGSITSAIVTTAINILTKDGYMNAKLFVTILFGIQDVYSKAVQIQQQEKHKIVASVNNAYLNLTPSGTLRPKVTWDYSLELTLKAFHTIHGGDWFFEDSGIKYNDDFKAHYKMFRLPLEPEFKDLNIIYWFHDTCNNKENDVLNIFRHRIGQKHCFKYSNCNPLEYTSFMSCNSMVIPREPGLPCSWAWRYYTQIIRQDLKSFACIRLGRPGPSTPNNQTDSFACYATLDKAKAPVGDVPYQAKPMPA